MSLAVGTHELERLDMVVWGVEILSLRPHLKCQSPGVSHYNPAPIVIPK